MLPESRRIAKFMLSHPSKGEWHDALTLENILQKKSPATARRQASLIRKRLETLDEAAWEMTASGDKEVATQILLASAIKHSRLLADFMRDVVVSRLRRLEHTLSASDWEAFFAECIQRDPEVGGWSDSTKAKLLQVIIRILSETRYLESTRSLKITPPILHPEVVRYLRNHQETTVLATMELTS